MNTIICLLLPFLGTTLGSLMVYFLKDKLNKKIEIIILGFAAGVMVAASIWSLIMPSIEISKTIPWLPATIGVSLGILLFYIIDLILKKIQFKKEEKQDTNRLMLAVTLHNIPEGMAIGVALASLISGNAHVTIASCFALSLGIAIQNFPEGAIISLPLHKKGYSKNKAFLYGVISAIFELLGALITLIFTNIISTLLPYLLASAAGAMLYVVVVELIPESNDKSNLNSLGFLVGFIIMMILDVALS